MNLSKPQPIHYATKAAPTRKTMGSDGVVITEKLPQNPNRKLMLNPSGHTYYLVLSNNAAQRGRTAYGHEKLNEKIKRGHLPLNECPVARGYVKMGDKACSGDDGRGNFTSGKVCKHIKKIMENRTVAHNEIQEERERKVQTDGQVLKEYIQLKIKEESEAAKTKDNGQK